MANVFRGTFDFTVRGADSVQRIERLFERLGMRVDMVYGSFRDGANTVERASARIHGLKEREINLLEEQIRLEHRLAEERLAPANRGRAYMQPTFGRAALPQGRIGTLTTDADGNLVDTETQRRSQEREARRAESERQRQERAEQRAAEARRLREEREAEARWNRTVRFQQQARAADMETAQRVRTYALQNEQLQLRINRELSNQEILRIRRIARAEREERRETIRQARIAQRHLSELTDRVGQTGLFQNFPIVRVFAFDMLRRTFTNIYQLVSQIGDKLVQWTVDSIKFNDELRRSETFFTSLGMLGFKNPDNSQMTLRQAKESQDPLVKNALDKSSKSAKDLMTKLMAISAETGQDLQEIVGATRQSTTDLLNKMVKKDSNNPYLKDPKYFNDITNRIVRLASVLRMSDPSNRKLSFHTSPVQELFSGSSGGKKDTGMAAVMSLIRREGIKIPLEFATKIQKYVNAGKLKEAMDTIDEALTKSGLGLEQLANFMDETLQPAIDGTIMFMKIFGATITNKFTDSLRFTFQEIVREFSAMQKNERFVKTLERIGVVFNQVLTPYLLKIARIIDSINNDPAAFEKKMTDAIKVIGDGMAIAIGLLEAAGEFLIGFFAGADDNGIKKLGDDIKAMVEGARGAGATFRWFIDTIIEWRWWIFGAIVTLKALSAVAAGLFIFQSIVGFLTATSAAGVTYAATILAVSRAWLSGLLIYGAVAISIASLVYQFQNLDTTIQYIRDRLTELTGINLSGWTPEKQKAREDSDWKQIESDLSKKYDKKWMDNWRKSHGYDSKVSAVAPGGAQPKVAVVQVAQKKQAPTALIGSIGKLEIKANDPKQLSDQLMKAAKDAGLDPSMFTAFGLPS